MSDNHYTLGGAQLGASTIPVQNINVNDGVQAHVDAHSGNADATFVGVLKQEPMITFGSRDLAACLGLVAIDGLLLNNTDTKGIFYLQKMAAGGVRSSGSDHEKVTVNNGFVVPTSISARQDSIAEISYDAHVLYDATNAPLVREASSYALTPSVSALHTVGPLVVNGTKYEVNGWDFNPGLNVQKDAHSGGAYPTFAGIMSRRPVLTATTKDAAVARALSAIVNITSLVWYARKMTAGGTRVADATEEHISFTAVAGMAHVQSVSASQDQTGEITITIPLVKSGATAIVAIDTTSAIA